jgi:hypothetical protein
MRCEYESMLASNKKEGKEIYQKKDMLLCLRPQNILKIVKDSFLCCTHVFVIYKTGLVG